MRNMHGSATVRLVPKLPANYVTLQQLKERREQELQRRKEEEEEELKKKQKEEGEREAARKKEEQERKLKEEEAAKKREEEERKHEEAPPNSSKPINRSVAAARIRQRARGGRAYLRTVHHPLKNSGAAHTTLVNDFSSRNDQRQKELSGTMMKNATTMPDRMQNKVVSRIGTSQQSISTETHEEEEKNKEVMPIVVVAENPKFVTQCADQRNRNFDKHLLQNPPPDREADGVTDKRSYRWKDKKKLVEKDFGKRKIVKNQNEDPRCVCPFREIDVESVSACTPKEERYDKKKNKGKRRKRYDKKKGSLNSEDRPAVYEDNEMLGTEGDPAKDSGYSPAGNRRETSAVGVVELTGHGGGNGSVGDEKEEVSVRMMQKGMREMTIHSTGASDRHPFRRGVSINKRNGEPRRGGRIAGDLPNMKPMESIEVLKMKTQIAEGGVVQEEKEEDIVKATQRDREDTRVSFNGRGRGRGFSGYRNRGNGFERFGDRSLMNSNYGERFSVKWMKKEDLR